MSYQFKIQLKNITKPLVWRRLILPNHFTFYQFHEVIQVAFGWQDSHMYRFSLNEYRSESIITDPDMYDEEDEIIVDSRTEKIESVFKHEGQKLLYLYDFGDDWFHTITLEKIYDDTILKADCVAGKGACPPEDCGGPWGYENLKEALTDPKHPEHIEFKKWLGLKKNEIWDPNHFNVEDARTAVRLV